MSDLFGVPHDDEQEFTEEKNGWFFRVVAPAVTRFLQELPRKIAGKLPLAIKQLVLEDVAFEVWSHRPSAHVDEIDFQLMWTYLKEKREPRERQDPYDR